MFLKHLINPKPSIILLFIVFCIVLVILPLFQFGISTVFYHSHLPPLAVLSLALIIPFFLSTGLNNIIYDKNIIRKDNFVVGFVFILISSPFINSVEIWGASFLLLFAFNFLLESYQKDLPFSYFYNASIILGSLTFIFPNLIWLALVIVIWGINYSNLNWRVIFTILLALATPYLFYFVFVFVSRGSFLAPNFFDFTLVSLPYFQELHQSKIVWLCILVLIMLFSFLELFMWLYKKSIKSRRTFITIIWFFLITTLIAIYSSWQYFYFALVPLAVIIGNYFVYTKKRKVANILFFLLVISSFYYKYMIGFNV